MAEVIYLRSDLLKLESFFEDLGRFLVSVYYLCVTMVNYFWGIVEGVVSTCASLALVFYTSSAYLSELSAFMTGRVYQLMRGVELACAL